MSSQVEKALRRVRTIEGMRFFNAPIGTPITPLMVSEAMQKHGKVRTTHMLDRQKRNSVRDKRRNDFADQAEKRKQDREKLKRRNAVKRDNAKWKAEQEKAGKRKKKPAPSAVAADPVVLEGIRADINALADARNDRGAQAQPLYDILWSDEPATPQALFDALNALDVSHDADDLDSLQDRLRELGATDSPKPKPAPKVEVRDENAVQPQSHAAEGSVLSNRQWTVVEQLLKATSRPTRREQEMVSKVIGLLKNSDLPTDRTKGRELADSMKRRMNQ